MKTIILRALMRIRQRIGSIECYMDDRHQAMTDNYDLVGEVDRFYQCARCGKDAITGQSFEKWIKRINNDRRNIPPHRFNQQTDSAADDNY